MSSPLRKSQADTSWCDKIISEIKELGRAYREKHNGSPGPSRALTDNELKILNEAYKKGIQTPIEELLIPKKKATSSE